MSSLSKNDLDRFKDAIWKDYGLKLEGKALYGAAFNLIEFFKALVGFDSEETKREK